MTANHDKTTSAPGLKEKIYALLIPRIAPLAQAAEIIADAGFG